MNINKKLEADSHFIFQFPLSQLRLIPDGENPWFLLIPMREGMIDWSDLKMDDQHQLTDEINIICNALKFKTAPDKLNVASLGNMVPQLHIHIIARYNDDRAWPGPIWGTHSNKPFDDSEIIKWQTYFKESSY
jgi:diadenosine tetraphosphate (Ap4A) HIT family hydrolase